MGLSAMHNGTSGMRACAKSEAPVLLGRGCSETTNCETLNMSLSEAGLEGWERAGGAWGRLEAASGGKSSSPSADPALPAVPHCRSPCPQHAVLLLLLSLRSP